MLRLYSFLSSIRIDLLTFVLFEIAIVVLEIPDIRAQKHKHAFKKHIY